MGGIFKAPSAPPPLPVFTSSVDTAASEAEKRRLASIARKRRGRHGLIATSSRGLTGNTKNGLLGLADGTSRTRTLLGG